MITTFLVPQATSDDAGYQLGQWGGRLLFVALLLAVVRYAVRYDREARRKKRVASEFAEQARVREEYYRRAAAANDPNVNLAAYGAPPPALAPRPAAAGGAPPSAEPSSTRTDRPSPRPRPRPKP